MGQDGGDWLIFQGTGSCYRDGSSMSSSNAKPFPMNYF